MRFEHEKDESLKGYHTVQVPLPKGLSPRIAAIQAKSLYELMRQFQIGTPLAERIPLAEVAQNSEVRTFVRFLNANDWVMEIKAPPTHDQSVLKATAILFTAQRGALINTERKI